MKLASKKITLKKMPFVPINKLELNAVKGGRIIVKVDDEIG